MAKGFLELDASIAIIILISIAAVLFTASIVSFGDLKEKTSTSNELMKKLIEECEVRIAESEEECIDSFS